MPHEFGKKWNDNGNNTANLTQDEIVSLIKNMKVTVAGKTRGTEVAGSIADAFSSSDEKTPVVVVEKGMHPDSNKYLHITVEYYFEKYHLYAARNGASAENSVNGWQIMVVNKLANVYNDPHYNSNMIEAKIAKQ